ncbi:MAG: extracellular solute-binding protein [Deltaproteobacteria bacterium]|nr:extracellular solute-binding protein [Candidatus Zymogenaceae bacterium]
MKYIAAISAVICISFLPCCRSSADTDTSIIVWAAMGTDEIRALKDSADRFERETGIAVRIVEIGLFEITTKLELAAPAGKGPDVVSISHTSVGTLSLMGLLAPLDHFSGLLACYPLPLVTAYRYRGVLMGVPLTVESYGLVVNKKLVKRVPETWEELFDEAARMTADTDGDGQADTYGFLTDPTNFYFTFPFYDARGAYIFKDRGPSGIDTADLGLCTPGGIEALTLLTYLTRSRRLIPVGITYPIITDLFSRGRLAMTVYGTYLISHWKQRGIDVGYHEIPPFADGRRGRPMSTLMGLGVSAYAHNPGGAERFITFLLAPENLRRFFELSGRTLVMADPGVYRDEDFAAVPYLRTALSIASDSYPFPNVPEGDLIWDAVSGAAETALSGTLSPREALCGTQERLSAVIREMRQ